MITTINKRSCQCVLVAIVAWFGYSNWAYAAPEPQIEPLPPRCELTYIPLPPLGELGSGYTQYLTQYEGIPDLVIPSPTPTLTPQYQGIPDLVIPSTPQYTSPSNGSTNNHGASQRAICQGECNQRCSQLSSFGQAALDACRREVSNCEARCR
jgi:hypothetical protein